MVHRTTLINADEESTLSEFISYSNDEKKQLAEEMRQSLIDGNDENARVAAARSFQIDQSLNILESIIEEQARGRGDSNDTNPTRYSNY